MDTEPPQGRRTLKETGTLIAVGTETKNGAENMTGKGAENTTAVVAGAEKDTATEVGMATENTAEIDPETETGIEIEMVNTMEIVMTNLTPREATAIDQGEKGDMEVEVIGVDMVVPETVHRTTSLWMEGVRVIWQGSMARKRIA